MSATGLIQSGKAWELRVVGEIPPGVPDEAVSAIIVNSFGMMLGVAPQVRGQTVTVHQVDYHAVMQRIEREQAQQGKPKIV